jgi:hypothetical protein
MSRAMQSMWVSLKSGSWLTPERLRLYPALLLDFEAVAALVLVVTSDGRHDFIGRPLGTDFAQVWVAGTEVLGGHPAQPFDVQAHLGAQRVFFGPATDVYGWHYPPYFLALAGLLALLPYGAALAVWQLSTLPLYLAGARHALRGGGLAGRDRPRRRARLPRRLRQPDTWPKRVSHRRPVCRRPPLSRHPAVACGTALCASRLQAAIRAGDPHGPDGRRVGGRSSVELPAWWR